MTPDDARTATSAAPTDSEPASTGTSDEPSQDAAATAAAQPSAGPDPSEGASAPAAASSAATDGSTDAAGGAARDLTALSLVDRHPSGTTLQVTSVQVEPTGVLVGVTVVNGYTSEISLNNLGVFVSDDQGNGYNLREPQKDDLAVAPGAELVGELVFLGLLDPAATTLSQKTNVFDFEDPIDLGSRFGSSTSPAMLIEGIPLD